MMAGTAVGGGSATGALTGACFFLSVFFLGSVANRRGLDFALGLGLGFTKVFTDAFLPNDGAGKTASERQIKRMAARIFLGGVRCRQIHHI